MMALEVTDLSYAYTRRFQALDGVSFSVREGSFTALLGPNGAGKTTLMALVTRLFAPQTGRITVCGFDLKAEPRSALGAMGVVFQRLTLDLDLTVQQTLRYAASLQGLPAAAAKARIAETAERLGLVDRLGAYVRTLSGGYRRRVELARALLHQPRLLILDEPTVGLDIDSRRGIVDYVHRLCREEGLAALWTTHLIDEIGDEDEVVVLHQGRVRAMGPLATLAQASGGGDLAQAYRALTTGPVPATV